MLKKLFGLGKTKKNPEQLERERIWRERTGFEPEGRDVVIRADYDDSLFEKGLYPLQIARVLIERGLGNAFEALAVLTLGPTVSLKKSKRKQAEALAEIIAAASALVPFVDFAARETKMIQGEELLLDISEHYPDRDELIEGELAAVPESGPPRHDLVFRTFVIPIHLPDTEGTKITEKAREHNVRRGEAYEMQPEAKAPPTVQSRTDIADRDREILEEFFANLDSKHLPAADREFHHWILGMCDERYLQEFEKGSFDRLGDIAIVDGFLGEFFKEKVCRSKREMQATIQVFHRFYRFLADRAQGPEAEQANSVVRALTKSERKLTAGLK